MIFVYLLSKLYLSAPMKDRKIVTSLQALSVYEMNSFVKYVNSPYFNVNKNLVTYLDMLADAIRQNKHSELSSENIWKHLFGTDKFNNQKLLKLSSDLVKLLEDFLGQKEYDDSLSLKSNLKLEGARKRSLDNLYNGILSEVSRLHHHELNQSASFYLTKYEIEKNIFALKTENEKKNEKFEIESGLNINKISDNLDFFYIAEKLRHFCTLLSWKKMYDLDIEMKNMDYVLAVAQQEPYSSIPAINIYYKIHLTYYDSDNTEHYFDLKSLITKFVHKFPPEEQREIFATAISYCLDKTNKNVTEFYSETLEIYKRALDLGILVLNNSIMVTTFRNVVGIALICEQFDWAENFIHEYAGYLDPRYRDNAVEFSLARLEFYRKNYSKVLEHLFRVNYEDVWYNLNAKTLQIASYYELDEFDALESLLQAFKMFVRREKSLSTSRKLHYLNLIKFTTHLMKISSRDKNKLQKLLEDIKGTKGIVSKPWLIEKVEQQLQHTSQKK